MKAVLDLNSAGKYDPVTFNAVRKWLWGTLYFLLDLSLGSRLDNQVVSAIDVHLHMKSSNRGLSNNFMTQFHDAFANAGNASGPLNGYIRHCAFAFSTIGKHKSRAIYDGVAVGHG